MTIWCQLGKKLLNMRKSLIYMMKKRPVFQEDQVLQNEDSATQKQLVLVRTEYKSSLSDFLFPATSNRHSSACLPWPCNLAHLGSLLTSSPDSFSQTSQPLLPTCTVGTCPLRTLLSFFFSKGVWTPLRRIRSRMSVSFKEIVFVSFTSVVRFLLYSCLGLRKKGIRRIK